MESWVFIVLLVIATPLALAIWLIVRAVQTRDRLEELSRRLSGLEAEVHRLRKEQNPAPPSETAPAVPSTYHLPTRAEIIEKQRAGSPVEPPQIPTGEIAPVPAPIRPPPHIAESVPPLLPMEETVAAPPRFQTEPGKPAVAWPPGKSAPAINWEQFMGVKLFAWIGGLALFLGVAFFVKYSFDNNLISPELRVAIGFAAGLGLLVGGIVMSRKNYPALSQTLCATGVVIDRKSVV